MTWWVMWFEGALVGAFLGWWASNELADVVHDPRRFRRTQLFVSGTLLGSGFLSAGLALMDGRNNPFLQGCAVTYGLLLIILMTRVIRISKRYLEEKNEGEPPH